MNRLFNKITFTLLLTLFSQHSLALGFEDAVFPELIVNGRALAMGNAFICKVDDSSASFYNPAGLGTVRWSHIHLSNLHAEANKGWMRTSTGGKIGNVFSGLTKGFSLDGQRKLLNERRGQLAHTRYQLAPNFTSRYVSFGYLFAKRTKSTISSEDGSQFEYATRRDHGPYASLNFSLFGGVFKLGVSAALVARKEAIGSSDPDTVVDLQDSDYKGGNALIVTSGMRLTLPVTYLPTFAVVVHNSLGSEFSSRHQGSPDEIQRTVDLGFSLTPQIGKKSRIHFEVNWKDFLEGYAGIKLSRRIVFGAEIDVMRKFFIRAGYGDGFGSGGIGVRTKGLEFDLTTYAVDTSDGKFRGKEDRRFSISLSAGL